MGVLRKHSGDLIFARGKGFFNNVSPNIVYLFVGGGFLSSFYYGLLRLRGSFFY